MFGLTFAHLSLRPNFPLSGSLSFPLSGKFGLRPDRKNDFTFWINFRSAESLVSAKDERKSEPKVKVTQCAETDQKDTSSVYDENSQFACPAHANCFGTSSMSLVQRQRRCDGRTSVLESDKNIKL